MPESADNRSMAIYLKITDTVYKLPNRIVIGRGAPFSQFNDDFDIGRRHCLLILEKDGVYIKDLGSKAGTFINDKKLPKNKLVKWDLNQSLRFGNHPASLHPAVSDNECVVVKALKGDKQEEMKIVNGLSLAFLVISQFMIWTSDSKAKIFLSLMFIAAAFGSYIIARIYLSLLSLKNMKVEEIFFSNEGFTMHYDSGGTMSIKLENVECWKLSEDGALIRMQNGDVFRLTRFPDSKKIVEYLQKEIPQKKEKGKPIDHKIWSYIGGFAGLFLYLFVSGLGINPTYLYAGLMLLLIPAAYYKLFNKNNSKWIPNSKHVNSKKTFLQISVISLVVIVNLFIGDYEEKESVLANQDLCSKGKTYACKFIDYSVLDAKEINMKAAQVSCEQKNKSACKVLKKLNREIASEKPEKALE